MRIAHRGPLVRACAVVGTVVRPAVMLSGPSRPPAGRVTAASPAPWPGLTRRCWIRRLGRPAPASRRTPMAAASGQRRRAQTGAQGVLDRVRRSARGEQPGQHVARPAYLRVADVEVGENADLAWPGGADKHPLG